MISKKKYCEIGTNIILPDLLAVRCKSVDIKGILNNLH